MKHSSTTQTSCRRRLLFVGLAIILVFCVIGAIDIFGIQNGRSLFANVPVATATPLPPTQVFAPAPSPTQSPTGVTVALYAKGLLLFQNDTGQPVTIQGGTITGKSGVTIAFKGPILLTVLPPFTMVDGTAVNPGAIGNIPPLDIDQPCCSNGVFVKNTAAFTGGQSA